ncbi:MAG: ABC transporter permease subunit [Flavobacteriales bacterium]|nr:ABC transporter permease subunit [Flavobacteriales bacterium]
MRTVFILARKELASFFDSLMAYLILVVFLGVSGFFTWWFGTDVFLRGLADLSTFFNVAYWTLFFFIPAITMRTLADERKSGTLDLLLTKAVSDRQVVTSKFLACFVLIALALACTLPYWITIAFVGDVDHGAIACGYLALLCMSAAYIAIGIYASSLTNNQIVAFLIGLAIIAVFHLAFSVMASSFTGVIGETLKMLSTGTHFDSMSRGIVDSRDLIWFGTLVVLGLSLAEMNLAKRLVND